MEENKKIIPPAEALTGDEVELAPTKAEGIDLTTENTGADVATRDNHEDCASGVSVEGKEESAGSPAENTPKRDNRRGGSVHRLVALSAFVALALILSFIESRIPTFVAIPGVKLGLANIVVVFCLYRMRAFDAGIVSLVRVALSSLLFGTLTSFLYGLAGACVSLAFMILLKRLNLGSIAVSTVGGVSHNIAQIAVASLLLETNVVGYYLPFLILSGTIAGIVVGVAGGLLEEKVPR